MSMPRSATQGLDEKQKKIIQALSKRNLKEKLENFILIEEEKVRREEIVSGYPYWLIIDPVNFCNLKCPFCPTGQGRGSRQKSTLSLDNFKKIIDEMGPYLIHMDFCNWGEPFLNRHLPEMIAYAERHCIDTKVDTNLNLLTEEDAEKIVLSGLDKIIVSIDGVTSETYSQYRVGGDLDKVMQNLRVLLRKKKELKKTIPYVSWQFLVFRHNEHEVGDVKRIGYDMGVDYVGITKAFIGNKDWIPLNEEFSNYRRKETRGEYTSDYFKKPQDTLCNWPWEAIAINPNGSVSPCCAVEDEKDDFGNIFQQPFREVWNNEKYRTARRHIKDKTVQSRDSNICINCRHSGMINIDILSCHSLFTQD